MKEHNAFKYCEPDAPTPSGLYWPEMKDDIWSYCYYLGSWSPRRRPDKKYDLGVYANDATVEPLPDIRGVSDATVDCPNNYVSGEICIPSYRGYNCEDGWAWRHECHYAEVLERALKHGFKVRAWHKGPVVTREGLKV